MASPKLGKNHKFYRKHFVVKGITAIRIWLKKTTEIDDDGVLQTVCMIDNSKLTQERKKTCLKQ
jgi:hypothetical protein